jgi:hypothetical protein
VLLDRQHVPERITSLASLPRLDTMFVCSRAEHRRHLTSKLGKRRLTNFNMDSLPAEVCEME